MPTAPVLPDECLFREEEMRRALDVLEQRRSAILAVTAPNGSERSRFLRELRKRAGAQSWNVIPSETEAPLRITEITNVAGFMRGLYRTLAPGSGASRIARKGSTDIAAVLREKAPVLVLLAEFCPDAAFRDWLSKEFVPTLHSLKEPVVFVLFDEGAPDSASLTLADTAIPLDRIDPRLPEQKLKEMCADVIPPLTDREAQIYAAAIASDPGLMSNLVRILQLQTAAKVTD